MPIVKGWFKQDKILPWDRWNSAYQYNDLEGPEFNAYPLIELLPRVRPDIVDLEEVSAPAWVVEIDPELDIGKINRRGEGTYIIELPSTFGAYFDQLDYQHRKKLRYVLKKNKDLELIYNQAADIDLLWQKYVAKIQTINSAQTGEFYSKDRLTLRRELYSSCDVESISFYTEGRLLAVNICKIEKNRIYDLACLRDDTPEVTARGVGTYATLVNIERAIEAGREQYDMLSFNFGYKTKFGAKELKLRHFLKCSEEFAKAYQIDKEDISILAAE